MEISTLDKGIKNSLEFVTVRRRGYTVLFIGDTGREATLYSCNIGNFEVIFGFNDCEKPNNDILNMLAKSFLSLILNKEYSIDMERMLPFFDRIMKLEPLDNIIYSLLKVIIDSGISRKVGFFVLNDQLLKLRGIVLAEKKGDDVVYDNLAIKKCYIDLKNKGRVADLLFFEKTEIVNTGDIVNENFKKFFGDQVIISGVYNKKGIFGAIIVDSDSVEGYDISHIIAFSKILSLSIDHSRLNKQLSFAMEDIAYFKESIDVTSNFTQMGKITASLAHEIKNPLVSIGGFARRLEKYVTDEKGLSYLQIIQTETARLEKIVSDILAYSKLFVLNKGKVDLYDLLSNIKEFFSEKLDENRIVMDIFCEKGISILADEKKLKQVLINIVNNSIQAIERDGNIYIEVNNEKDRCEILIKDTGGGFPFDVIQNAFQPFYTTKENGTGLGLSICQKIVAAHGGHMFIDNYDNGALVKISI